MPLLESINHLPTWITVGAERRVTQHLGATCNLPVAVFAELSGDVISLSSFISDVDGQSIMTETEQGDRESYLEVAQLLAERLIDRGAARLLGVSD